MAGNFFEWTAEWGQWGTHYATAPTSWGDLSNWNDFYSVEWDSGSVTSYYNDDMAYHVAGRAYTNAIAPGVWVTGLPTALIRGEIWAKGKEAGVFSLSADDAPSRFNFWLGARCAKN